MPNDNDENKLGVKMLMVHEGGRILRHLITSVAVILVAYFIYRCFAVLSGRTTNADIAVEVVASAPLKYGSVVLVVVMAVIWALTERVLRRSKTEYLTRRIRSLETFIDENRESSSLAPTGATNPEDK